MTKYKNICQKDKLNFIYERESNVKEITSFVYDNPWIIFVVMTIMFYVSIGCVVYRQSKRKKAFKIIKSMRNNNELSKA